MQTPAAAYDYRRRSSPYHSRRSASPPRRRPSPGRREDGRFSPRRPPPREGDQMERPTYRRSRSRTRSHTPRLPAPQVEVQPTEPSSEIPPSAPGEGAGVPPKPSSPHSQKSINQPSGPSEVHVPKSSIPIEATPESTVDTDVTMVDVRPPTQPKAFSVSTAVPPTQPKNFNRPPPTGPRLAPTTPGQLHPSHQPPTSETPSAPVPTQPDPGPAIADAPIEEEPKITLPRIEELVLPTPRGMENAAKTVNRIQSHVVSFSYASTRSMNFCEKVISCAQNTARP